MKKKLLIPIGLFAGFCVLPLILWGNGKKTWDGNILVITLDTTRADTIGCYGDPDVRTPNINKLGKDGIRFKNCYSPVPLTLPSHCTIFTGKYPIGHGVRNNGHYYLKKGEKTLAEFFKQKGYHTYAVIAAFVLSSKFGLRQGFDIYDDSLDTFNLVNTFRSEIRADKVYKKFDAWFQVNWSKKFFAWVHFYDPHTPYHPPEGFFKDKDKNDLFALYKGEISFMDVYIGKILEALKTKNILDKTMVVVVGDHGEAFGEHKEFAEHELFCYEENIKVPFIVYNPHFFEESAVIKNRVSTCDIMPTLLELTGIKYSDDIQGRSLASLLNRGRVIQSPSIYIESMFGKEEMGWAPLSGIIEGDYKFISLPKPELYHLTNDPGEKKNMFRIKSNISRKLDKKLAKLVLKYSSLSRDSKRKLTQRDIQHLKTLGYISAFSKKKWTGLDPKRGIVFNNRLKVLEKKIKRNELKGPEQELEEIIGKKPEMVNYLVYQLLYQISMRRNDIEGAIQRLNSAIKKFPDSLAFRYLRTRMLFHNGQYEKAVLNCQEILKRDPFFNGAIILMGDIYDKIGKPKQSIDYYFKALKIEPNNISLKIRYADLLIKNGKFKQTLHVYDDMLENWEVRNNVSIVYKIAVFNFKNGSLAKAEMLLKRVVELYPSGPYYFKYALVLARNGKRAEAIKYMQIALKRYNNDLSAEEKKNGNQSLNLWKDQLK